MDQLAGGIEEEAAALWQGVDEDGTQGAKRFEFFAEIGEDAAEVLFVAEAGGRWGAGLETAIIEEALPLAGVAGKGVESIGLGANGRVP